MQQTRAAYAVDYSELEDAERDGSDQDGDGERFNGEESENPNLQGMGTVKGTAERKHDKQANDLALVPYGEYGKTRSAYHNKHDVKMAENLTVERLAERVRERTERESERERREGDGIRFNRSQNRRSRSDSRNVPRQRYRRPSYHDADGNKYPLVESCQVNIRNGQYSDANAIGRLRGASSGMRHAWLQKHTSLGDGMDTELLIVNAAESFADEQGESMTTLYCAKDPLGQDVPSSNQVYWLCVSPCKDFCSGDDEADRERKGTFDTPGMLLRH
ncbi:hypothetical protein LZ32DRAFT_256796 [Colletotrichum eremochloae]|nr:hypothetical protein LZ32DRAFT_256796 [Colletotrichum eremochloae]